MAAMNAQADGAENNLARAVDGMRLRGVFLKVPILCTLIMVFEGMDNNIISYVGPLMREELGLSATVLGLIYSATVASALIGAAGVAPLSDRWGRRPLLLATSVVMCLCTLATPLLHTAWSLVLVRFVVGIAFGAAVPSTFALAADYAPKRFRAMLVMIVTAGVALGYVGSGLLSASIIPAFGWRPLMLGLAAFSAVWTVVLYLTLPEAPQFLVTHRPNDAQTAHLLGALGLHPDAVREEHDAPHGSPRPHSLGIVTLLSPAYRLTTLTTLYVVCSVYAVELMMSYWLPSLLMAQGLSVRSAATIAAVGKIASIAGSIGVGWLMDRRGLIRVLSATFFCAAVAFALLALAFSTPVLLLPAVICMCFFLDGSFSGSQALTVTSYPGELRATASGWITGLARLVGGGFGTFAGGLLISAGVKSTQIALLLLVLMALAGAMLLAIGNQRRRAASLSPNYEAHLRSTI